MCLCNFWLQRYYYFVEICKKKNEKVPNIDGKDTVRGRSDLLNVSVKGVPVIVSLSCRYRVVIDSLSCRYRLVVVSLPCRCRTLSLRVRELRCWGLFMFMIYDL